MSAEKTLSPRRSLPRRLRAWLAGWKLREVPPGARTLIVCIEVVALAAFLYSLSRFELRAAYVGRWILLAGLSVLQAEVAGRIERMRRYLASSAHVTMTSVWAFSAVIALPAAYAGTLVVLLFGMLSWQRRRQRSMVPHRDLFSASTALLAALAAGGVHVTLLNHLPSIPGGGTRAIAVLSALLVYFGVNVVLVLSTIYLAVSPVPVRQLLPDREELALEIGTLVLGLLTSAVLVGEPWLTPLVLILIVLLQRSSLVSQLEVAAATDTKTGLLNASAWQELAQRELVRSQHMDSPCALLLLDLDHFKAVNDTLGHLAGDTALRAIGEALKRELRGYDAVARFGGEEFVVFLNDLNLEQASVVAERTLARVRGLVISGIASDSRQLTLTASIGLASYPQHGQDLTDLLEAADLALYAAKRNGRDQVGLPPSSRSVAHPA